MNIGRFQNIHLKTKPQASNEVFTMKVEDMTFSTLLKSKSDSQLRTDVMSKNAGERRFSKPNMDRRQFLKGEANRQNAAPRAVNEVRDAYRNERVSEDEVAWNRQNALYQEVSTALQSDVQNSSQKVEDVKEIMKKLEDLQDVNHEGIRDLLAALSQILQSLQEMQAQGFVEEFDLSGISEMLESVSLLSEVNLSEEDAQKLFEMATNLQEMAHEFGEILEQRMASIHGKNATNEDAANRIHELLGELNAQSVEVAKLEKTVSGENSLQELHQDVEEIAQEQQDEMLVVQGRGEQAGSSIYADRETMKSTSGDVASEENALEDFKNIMEITNRDLKSNMMEKTITTLQKNTSTHEIYSQIKEGMSKLDLSGNLHEIVIKLKPEELGKVELKLELYKDFIIAKFDVENQAVKEAIESNLKDLRSSLQQSGYNNMQFDVNVGTGGRDEAKQSPFTGSRSQSDIELNEGIKELNAARSLHSMIEETSFEYLA